MLYSTTFGRFHVENRIYATVPSQYSFPSHNNIQDYLCNRPTCLVWISYRRAVGHINAFLKRCYKCGFCTKLYTVEELADDADYTLFSIRCKRHSTVYMKSFLRLKPAPFTYVTKATSMNYPDALLKFTKDHSSHAVF